MNNTWGPGCDRLIFFVDKVVETIAVEQIDLHVAGDGELGLIFGMILSGKK